MWQRELLTRATMTMVEIRQERERKLSGQLEHKGAKFFPKESFFPPPLPLPGWKGNKAAAEPAAAAEAAAEGGGGEAGGTPPGDTPPKRKAGGTPPGVASHDPNPTLAGIIKQARRLVQPLEEGVQRLVFEAGILDTELRRKAASLQVLGEQIVSERKVFMLTPGEEINRAREAAKAAAAAAAAAEAIAEGRKPEPAAEPRKRSTPFPHKPPSKPPPLPSAGEKGAFLLKVDKKVRKRREDLQSQLLAIEQRVNDQVSRTLPQARTLRTATFTS